MLNFSQLAARRKYHTDNLQGVGEWARVARCKPGAPIVRLHSTMAEAEASAARGVPCMTWGCRADHAIERVEQLTEAERDALTPEIGYRERVRA